MNKKIIVGILTVFFLFGGVLYIQFSDDARIRIDDDKTTFYVKNSDNQWVVGGREFNSLWDGTTKMNRDLSSIVVSQVINNKTGEVFITRRTELIRGPIIIDEYVFDGFNDRINNFPVSHDVRIINGSGLIYQYEVRDLEYDGPTIRNVDSPYDFGRNMKVDWQDGNYWSTVYQSGILKVRYRISSDDEVFSVRLFDPPQISLSLDEYSSNFSVELGSVINVTATINDSSTVCVDVDHADYGINYSCAINKTSFLLNITRFFDNRLYSYPSNSTSSSGVVLDVSSEYSFQEDSDENYSYYISSSGYGAEFVSNYTKPANAVGAIMQVAHGGINESDYELYNVTLPEYCFDAVNGEISVMMYSFYIPFLTTGGSQPYCYSGSTYTAIGMLISNSSYVPASSTTSSSNAHAFDGNYSTGISATGSSDSIYLIDPISASFPTYSYIYEEAIFWIIKSRNDTFYLRANKYDDNLNWSVNASGINVGGFPTSINFTVNESEVAFVSELSNSSIISVSEFTTGISEFKDFSGFTQIASITIPKEANVTSAVMNVSGSDAEEAVLISGPYDLDGSSNSAGVFAISPFNNKIWAYASLNGPLKEYSIFGVETGNSLGISPEGATTNSTHLFIQDGGTVNVYNKGRTLISSWNITDMSSPTGMTRNSTHLFVANYSGEVHAYTYGGTPLGEVFDASNELLFGEGLLSIAADDYFFYAGSAFDDVIYKYDSSGAYQNEFFDPGIPADSTDSRPNSLDRYSNELLVGDNGGLMTRFQFSTYPQNVYLEIGRVDGAREYSASVLNTKSSVNDFSDELNTYLSTCVADFGGNCAIPIFASSTSYGRITLSELSLSYEYSSNPIILSSLPIEQYISNIDKNNAYKNNSVLLGNNLNYTGTGNVFGGRYWCEKITYSGKTGYSVANISSSAQQYLSATGGNYTHLIRLNNESASPNTPIYSNHAICDPEEPIDPSIYSCLTSAAYYISGEEYWICAGTTAGTNDRKFLINITTTSSVENNTVVIDESYGSAPSFSTNVNASINANFSFDSTIHDVFIPINVKNSGFGSVNITSAERTYRGGMDVIDIIAHNSAYTVNNTIRTTHYYSKWNYNFPTSINYFEFIPNTANSTQVQPIGQSATIPFLNITGFNYAKNASIKISINESYSCINISASADNNYSNAIILNSSDQTIKNNSGFLENSKIWFFADYACNSSNWALWQPNINIKQCCLDCECDSEVIN